jgi:hypothetical protein
MRARPFILAVLLAGFTVCSVAAPRTTTFSSKPGASVRQISMPLRDEPADFQGNEVRQAIANYYVDSTGDVYEEHVPEAEVPRLAPPKG